MHHFPIYISISVLLSKLQIPNLAEMKWLSLEKMCLLLFILLAEPAKVVLLLERFPFLGDERFADYAGRYACFLQGYYESFI